MKIFCRDREETSNHIRECGKLAQKKKEYKISHDGGGEGDPLEIVQEV